MIAATKQGIDYHTTKLIVTLAGEGNKTGYDSFKGTDVFEFFRLLWVHEDLVEDRIKRQNLETKK